MWAMREIAFAGSSAQTRRALTADLALDFVVTDQFIDRTSGREDTFYDGPKPARVRADPYCPDLRGLLVETARSLAFPCGMAARSW